MPVDADILSTAEWFIGEDKVLTFTVRDAGGTAQDITGWTLGWVLRLTRYHPTVLLTKATGSGIALLTQSGGTLGQFTVTLARADTSALKAGTYYHAANRSNTGAYDVVAEGKAVLRKAAAH